jgi:hypothetical protein
LFLCELAALFISNVACWLFSDLGRLASENRPKKLLEIVRRDSAISVCTA